MAALLQRIDVLNAEDLAVTANRQWVIASSLPGGAQQGGGLSGTDAETGAVHKLHPNEAAGAVSGMAECKSPVLPAAFVPDNLRWGQENSIQAAGLRGGVEAVALPQRALLPD